jgi:hypothetical protein
MTEEPDIEALCQRLDEVATRLAYQEGLVAQLLERIRSLEARLLRR